MGRGLNSRHHSGEEETMTARFTGDSRLAHSRYVPIAEKGHRMNKTRLTLVIGAAVCAAISLATVVGHAQSKGPHAIDPTADIHPSVILEGQVTVGAYTKIGAGTVITGNVTIGQEQ
jgi:UDP-3-O-[3-hydroxymyristoyl] glucosamine N-acyltransferase